MDLAEMGLSSSSFRFGHLTMESDRFVCVKDVSNGDNQVVVIDMHKQNAVTRKPMKAEGCLMNPVDNIIALRGKTEGQTGHFIQIFNLDTKQKLAVHQFPENIVLWKWLKPRQLAVISDKSVYHWKVEGGEEVGGSQQQPEKIFDRQGKLAEASTQLIGYASDKEQKWCVLVGISTQDGGKSIDGSMQLYSIEKKQQQMLEGHTGCFANVILDDAAQGPTGVFMFAERKKDGGGVSRLHVMDIYSKRGEGLPPPFKVAAEIQYPPENPNDFPVAMHCSEKYGVVYLISKAGYLFMFDPSTGVMLFRHRVSPETVFITADNLRTGGVLMVNRKGQVLTATVNEQAIVPYIQTALTNVPNRQAIAIGLAKRYGLPGADDLLVQQFNQFFATGEYKAAARVVATMKSGGLRTAQTIQMFKTVQQTSAPAGTPSPILQYFSTLLEYGSLNQLESTELARPVVAQGRREFIEKWLKEEKLACSEELGDIVKPLDGALAMSVYIRAKASAKVIQSFVEQGQYEKIVEYAKETNYRQIDYSMILRSMVAAEGGAGGNSEGAVQFAKQLLDNEPPLIDIHKVIEVLLQQNRLQETTSILLEYLKANKPEHSHLQTKLLEMNLHHAPQAAETIFQMDMFSHYDRHTVAGLCEKAGLYQRALEHYSDVTDIKRVMVHTGGNISAEWMTQFFGKMAPEVCLEILSDMLRNSRGQAAALQTVVQTSIKFNEQIGSERLIAMFESFGSWEGLFYYLGAIMAFSQDPEVHYKYIEAAAKLNHMQEVERVCRESSVYDPVKVKEFLKQAKLPDPRPLIYVCDLHGYVAELAEFLYKNNLVKYIEVYVIKVNPSQAPVVIGTLIDLDCTEDFIKNLLQNLRSACPVVPLVEEVEKRNRLRLLLPWLEGRLSEGNKESELHNALAKIYIDTNRDAEEFLKTNQFYDSKVVGMYCEDRDPHLAYTAYRRSWGVCDMELVNVTNVNGLFRLQARYLVERMAPELWAAVLTSDDHNRRSVIDQVVSTALPESTNAEEVSATVKAFIAADLPNELIELLEKIVLHNSDFSANKNLQNLLILTAIKADKTRVVDYINRLENYDGPEIAKIALQYDLSEEAFIIYKKFNLNTEAIDTLLVDDKKDSKHIARALEFAFRSDEPAVWTKMGSALLADGGGGRVGEAIDCFLKAEDATSYKQVIDAAVAEGDCYDALVQYLQMARKKSAIKDQMIDTELMYAFAKADRLVDMEEFVMGANTANVQVVGDRLFDEQNYNAAKILYTSIPNNSKLASCHVRLGEFTEAIEAAKKASNPSTWKLVSCAAIEAGELKCAHASGLALVVHPDHLESLIALYEDRMLIDELTALLEAGVHEERGSHVGVYTELAIMYAKYTPAKLMEFCRSSTGTGGSGSKSSYGGRGGGGGMLASTKLNIPKVIRVCEEEELWKEAVFLHICYDEYDQAANKMILHSPSAYTHEQFMQIIQQVSNSELLYRAVDFYVGEYPMQLNALLKAMEKKIDHGRVVQQMRKCQQLSLVMPYLQSVQCNNISAVNEALSELYLEQENWESLRDSILEHDNFDQLGLASKLEKHDLLEMRRLAVLLYRKNKKFKQAIELSKRDDNYSDAMQAAKDSQNQQLVESLLRSFLEIKNKECFSACLHLCYELIRPDIALELAWRYGYMDQAMPFVIQTLREYTYRVDILDKKVEHRELEEEKQRSAPNDYVPDYSATGPMLGGMGNLALMPPPSMPSSGGAPMGGGGPLGSLARGGMMGAAGMGMMGAPMGSTRNALTTPTFPSAAPF
eukprot:GHVS01066380.1.p1 GENE.GHVS01066380.1~~GHVS01066380.1.p1  ORF type:complete len:1807 (-),score=256.84 GHVS01066380.1:448-5775(-)